MSDIPQPDQITVVGDTNALTNEQIAALKREAAESMWEHDRRQAEAALYVDTQEHQDSMVHSQPLPPKRGDIVELDKEKKVHLTITDVADPVQAIAFMHPEFAAAAVKHGVDLTKHAGRELQEMRKYFGQGSGVYLVTVNFRLARTEAFKLDERAQRKMAKVLAPKKPAKKKTKKATRNRKVKK